MKEVVNLTLRHIYNDVYTCMQRGGGLQPQRKKESSLTANEIKTTMRWIARFFFKVESDG